MSKFIYWFTMNLVVYSIGYYRGYKGTDGALDVSIVYFYIGMLLSLIAAVLIGVKDED